MARSYAGLVNMAKRFGFRLARAREGSQHRGVPVRYLLEDKNGVTPFRSLEEVDQKLSTMAEERAKRAGLAWRFAWLPTLGSRLGPARAGPFLC
jgi:hypothetical protein